MSESLEMAALRSYLRLHLADGIGAVLFKRLTDAFGSPAAVFEHSPGDWMRVDGIGKETARNIAAVTDAQVDDELAAAGKMSAAILCLDDAAYPAALKNIYDPPPVLYVRGQLAPGDAVAIGIVGSRRCTHYGLEQAERFGQFLGRAGMTVVSGGARGIDTAAHRGALSGGSRTIAVMGCGLCKTYPPENAALFDQIIADGRGALVSELPMKTSVLAGSFPTRNRIISGLSLGVIVVEAARRSGSLITAREAADQGRVVFAVPGRVDNPLSQGSNELIRNGAILVQTLEDVLEHLGQVGQILAREDEPEAGSPPPGLNETEAKVFASLSMKDDPMGLDELVRATGLASGQVAAAMTMLVLKGAVLQHAGNLFARRKGQKKEMLF